jgi:iron complex transport system substrate-binding protein|tara:strand:- start:12115 stop:13149 length:1035 start_codon:yes stop_codon:yes gene_type:complete
MLAISRSRPIGVVLGAAVVCLSLTGAGAAQTAGGESGGTQCGGYPAPAFPDLTPVAGAQGSSTIASGFGDVEMPTAPEAALGMYTTDVDILIWLGFPLAGSQPIRSGNGYSEFPCFFPQAQLEGITTFGNYPDYNYEAILLAEPDFILNGLGYDEAVNERLPQIAPTYSVNAFDGRFWQDHFEETAEALGRPGRYGAWLEIYQTRLAEVRDLIGDADLVVSPLGYWDGTFSASCYVGVECAVFEDLGLTIFEGALRNEGDGVALSPEEIGQFDVVDYAFIPISVGDEGLAAHATLMEEAARNPLWARLNVVEDEHIVPFELEMVFGSPSGQLAFLEVVAQTLSQ